MDDRHSPPLHRPQLNPLHQILLRCHEQHDQRHDVHDARGHQQVGLLAEVAVEIKHPDRQRAQMIGGDDECREPATDFANVGWAAG